MEYESAWRQESASARIGTPPHSHFRFQNKALASTYMGSRFDADTQCGSDIYLAMADHLAIGIVLIMAPLVDSTSANPLTSVSAPLVTIRYE